MVSLHSFWQGITAVVIVLFFLRLVLKPSTDEGSESILRASFVPRRHRRLLLRHGPLLFGLGILGHSRSYNGRSMLWQQFQHPALISQSPQQEGHIPNRGANCKRLRLPRRRTPSTSRYWLRVGSGVMNLCWCLRGFHWVVQGCDAFRFPQNHRLPIKAPLSFTMIYHNNCHFNISNILGPQSYPQFSETRRRHRRRLRTKCGSGYGAWTLGKEPSPLGQIGRCFLELFFVDFDDHEQQLDP